MLHQLPSFVSHLVPTILLFFGGDSFHIIAHMVASVVNANICMVDVLDAQKITTFLNVIIASEQNIHLFKRDFLSLRNKEPYK